MRDACDALETWETATVTHREVTEGGLATQCPGMGETLRERWEALALCGDTSWDDSGDRFSTRGTERMRDATRVDSDEATVLGAARTPNTEPPPTFALVTLRLCGGGAAWSGGDWDGMGSAMRGT